MPRESAVVKGIRKLLRERGAWDVKTHPEGVGRAGVPDILACYRGRFIAVEVKQPGGRVREIQRYEGAKIIAAGGQWLLADHVDQVRVLLDTLDTEVRWALDDGSCWS